MELDMALIINGNNTSQEIIGTFQTEKIFGFGGDDTIFSGARDLSLEDPNQDSIYGGTGNDRITLDDGGYVDGESGYDSIFGSNSNDTIYGGTGNDSVYGGEGADRIYLGTGHDFALGGADDYGPNTIDGGDGNDTLIGTYGSDTLLGGNGNDSLYGGDEGDDTANNREAGGKDYIDGGAGKDYIDANVGQDTVKGGAGNDTIYGSTGSDSLRGGEDNDLISGGTEHDKINGEIGNDKVDGGLGNDTVYGGDGDDRAYYALTVNGFSALADVDIYSGDDGTDTLVLVLTTEEQALYADEIKQVRSDIRESETVHFLGLTAYDFERVVVTDVPLFEF